MAESKGDGLNESYYGPSIPPNEIHHQTQQASLSKSTPYSILCIIVKIVTLIIIGIGIAVLILWLVFQPSDLKVYVDKATLSRFDLDANNRTLHYNLTLAMSFRNPNDGLGIYYERIEGLAFYDGSRFGYVDLPKLQQPKDNTTTIDVSFVGQGLLVGDSPVSTYKREKDEGWFYVSVKMYTRVRLKMIVVHSVQYRPDIDCSLRLPVPSNSTSVAAGFTGNKCDVQPFS